MFSFLTVSEREYLRPLIVGKEWYFGNDRFSVCITELSDAGCSARIVHNGDEKPVTLPWDTVVRPCAFISLRVTREYLESRRPN